MGKTKKVKALEPAVSTSAERYAYLRETFPECKVAHRSQVAEFIHVLRFEDDGRSWEQVADVLNENKLIHSQWRRDTPEWTAKQACAFAHRYDVIDKRIWRSNGYEEDQTVTMKNPDPITVAVTDESTPPSATIRVNYEKVTFEACGESFAMEGEWSQHDGEPLVRLVYKGVPDAHFLRFLRERGLPTSSHK